MMHRSVTVKLARKADSYDISIGSGLLTGDTEWPSGGLRELGGKIAVVSNKTVFGLYGEALLSRLKKDDGETCVHLIGDGERYKNFKTLEQTLGFLSENKIGGRIRFWHSAVVLSVILRALRPRYIFAEFVLFKCRRLCFR